MPVRGRGGGRGREGRSSAGWSSRQSRVQQKEELVELEEEELESMFSFASGLQGGRKKYSRNQLRAVRRILRDLKDIHQSPIPNVHAEPIDPNNLFCWHGNLRGPDHSPFEGGIFHITIDIPDSYPSMPPAITLSTEIPHPFLINGTRLSLDMITDVSHTEPYTGWSPAYSIQTILLQLQSFLLDGLEASTISTGVSVSFSQKQTSAWKQVFENKDVEGEGTLKPDEIRDLMVEVGERKPSPAELALYYRMLSLPKDHAIDFSSFLRILQKKREYRKYVESANNYSCNNPKCKHKPQYPYPEFPDITVKDFVNTLSEPEMIKNETVCFFSKKTFTAPDMATLGVGVYYTRNFRNGKIHNITSPLDLISLEAFRKHKVTTCAHNTQQRCSHWLPLYINAEHGERALHLAPRSLGVICSESHLDFKPEMILEVFPKLMSGLILPLVKGQAHVSVRALEGYCAFHRLFIALVEKYPSVKEEIHRRVQEFIKSPEQRNKDIVPSLQDFLCMASAVELDCLNELFVAYTEEMMVRDVAWVVKKNPELDVSEPDAKVDRDRVKKTFATAVSSYQILLFHKYFLTRVAHLQPLKDLIELYDSRYGRPTTDMMDGLLVEFKRIQDLNSYDEFFRRLGCYGEKIPSDEQLLGLLRNSVKISKERYYHGPKKAKVVQVEKFLQDQLKGYTGLQELVVKGENGSMELTSDEQVWKKLCGERFDIHEQPPEDDIKYGGEGPWRHCYLRMNVEDRLMKFNDNPDFKSFYSDLELSSKHLRLLEYTVMPVNNVKSNYHFLTALLTKLEALESFTVKKGEVQLGLKGCKALCKGLKNNNNSIRTLDLHFTQFTSECVKELEEGLLASEGLVTLNLEGNPVETEGARSIARVLKAHPSITELNVGSCMLNDQSAQYLASSFYHNKSLKRLRLNKNSYSHTGLHQILHNLAYSRTVEELYLCNGSYNFDNQHVGVALTKLFEVTTSLKHINFYKSNLNNVLISDAIHALGQNRSITDLDFAETNLGSDKCKELGYAIARNKNIVKLVLDGNSLYDAGIVSLSEAIYDTEIAIEARRKAASHRALNEAEMEEEIRPRGCALEYLSLSKCGFSFTAANIAFQRLIQLTVSLKHLNLSQSNLGIGAGESIGKALSSHPSLLHLDLSGNNMGEHGIKKLCRGLATNTVLEHLDISRNDIGGRGAGAVATMLSNSNSQLKGLVMYGNFVGIEGARFIAGAIRSNSTLTELDLGLNRMRPKGITAIAEALTHNSTLQILKLKLNFVNDRSGMYLAESIVNSQNSAIRKVCLANNGIKEAIFVQIMNTLKEKNVELDVCNHLAVTERSRLQRTVYCTPLPGDISKYQLAKVFYDGGCGAILSVSIHKHKRPSIFATSKYAFVEFADENGAVQALDVGSEKNAKIGRKNFNVIQAGI